MTSTATRVLPAPPAGPDGDIARRWNESARATAGVRMTGPAFERWFGAHRREKRFEVNPIPFTDLRGWQFRPGTGDLGHESGRFFTIEGLRVDADWPYGGRWSQPIINQPEIGLLGILVKEFDGVLHCLMQAKMEPGNTDTVQLSPSVQATRSNYTGVHRGRPIPLLEYFMGPERGRVLIDVLQSEQGSWFLRKRNRNMVVEVTGDVPDHPDFCWLTIGQIQELLRRDNVVNMDARTVLSCIPFTPDAARPNAAGDKTFQAALCRSMDNSGPARHNIPHLLSWLTGLKTQWELTQRTIPLDQVDHWRRTAGEIAHEDDRYFRVIAVEVAAHNREVGRWTQPLLAPVGQGRVAFLVRVFDGVLHVLIRAQIEAGTLNVAELGPTVSCNPDNYTWLPPDRRPPLLDFVRDLTPDALRYDAVQSEEGGRFHHADNRYQIAQVGDNFPDDPGEDFRWMTMHQLNDLLRHSNYINVQARTLIACLNTIW